MTDFKLFQYHGLVRERHLDTFGHVNNATYLEMLEEARWDLLNDGGISLKSIHAESIGPIVLECQIRFLKELRLRQSFVIESQMISFENKTGLMRQDIFDEQHQLCTEARLTFGIFDMKIRRLILPPKHWLEAVGVKA